MNEWTNFQDLDLSSIEASGGSTRLTPGTYKVTARDVLIETFGGADGSQNNKRLKVDFVDTASGGDIRKNFNVHFPTKEKAESIGRSELKSFLIAAGHATPDKPGDAASIEGLSCTIIVGNGKPFMKNGEQRQYPEVKRFSSADAEATGAATPADLDDDIPF